MSGDWRGTLWTLLLTFCIVTIRFIENFWSPCTYKAIKEVYFSPPPSHAPPALQPLVGHDLLIFEGSRSHTDTPHSVGLLWTSDQPDAETTTWQHTTLQGTDVHAPGGIRTHNPSKRAAADPCLRLQPRGHWVRPDILVFYEYLEETCTWIMRALR
jgi:hypothetical protein